VYLWPPWKPGQRHLGGHQRPGGLCGDQQAELVRIFIRRDASQLIGMDLDDSVQH
jgi:hypothetical protein